MSLHRAPFTKLAIPLLIAVSALAPALHTPATVVANARPSVNAGQAAEPGLLIQLAAATFDPLQSQPQLPQALTYSAEEAASAATYLLQFNGPVLDEWKQAVLDAGGILGDYVPDSAFLARLDGAARNAVQTLPFVRWVGPYQPAYKLAPGILMTDTRSYRVILAPWSDGNIVGAALAALTASTRAHEQGFTAVLNGDQVAQIARQGDVVWIEPIYMQHLYNDVGGKTIMGGSTAWANGYNGSGMSIAVADTGLDTGVAGTIHLDFAGRVAHISSWPVQAANYGGGCLVTNPGVNDGAADKESGHGSHVTGSVAGSGARSSNQIRGLAYAASINFQAVEQWTTYTAACGVGGNAGYGLSGIPDDVRTLLNEAYGWGARTHNNSWGGGVTGQYDQQASYFDDFIHNHPDMLVVAAAGNAGRDSNADGYVDENSISSPATAKNVLTIGASENERTTGGYSTDVWGTGSWLSLFPQPPTRDDRISSSREHMAAFSSRGPMNDGRIKPDLVAPGTDILSVRSSQATEDGWGPYNAYYMYMGGTSMASPLSTGAATLVREFYVEHEHVIAPSAALIKATLINAAVDINGYGNINQEAGKRIPNNHEGWGRINVGAATTAGRRFVDNTAGINTGVTRTYNYTVTSSTKPFKVSLVWSDHQGAALANPSLVNNLNLRVTAPGGGAIYLGNVFSSGWSQTGGSPDTKNNVENVYVQTPGTGVWKVEVIGQNIPQGPQPYALVVDGWFAAVKKAYLPAARRPAAPVSSIQNGSFESGATGWTQSATSGYPVIINTGFPGTMTPHSGSWAAWLGGAYDDTSYIQQQVTVQAGNSYLSYYHWIASQDGCGFDVATVRVNGVAADTYDLCSSINTNGWVKHVVNLGAYVGQSVALQIRVVTDGSLNSNLFIDDVAFQSTPAVAMEQPAQRPAGADPAAEPKPTPGSTQP